MHGIRCRRHRTDRTPMCRQVEVLRIPEGRLSLSIISSSRRGYGGCGRGSACAGVHLESGVFDFLGFGTGLESSVAREDQFPALRRSTPDSGHFVETEPNRAVIGTITRSRSARSNLHVQLEHCFT
jgi:hypothetical protein